MVANARCAAWLRSDGNGHASRQTGERGGRFKKGGLDRQFRRMVSKHLRVPRAAIAVADLYPPLSFSFCHPT